MAVDVGRYTHAYMRMRIWECVYGNAYMGRHEPQESIYIQRVYIYICIFIPYTNAYIGMPYRSEGTSHKSALQMCVYVYMGMGWLRLVGFLKWQVSFAKEPYKRDYTLQKRPMILRSLLIVVIP